MHSVRKNLRDGIVVSDRIKTKGRQRQGRLKQRPATLNPAKRETNADGVVTTRATRNAPQWDSSIAGVTQMRMLGFDDKCPSLRSGHSSKPEIRDLRDSGYTTQA